VPEDELSARGIGVLPATLADAIDAMEKDPMIQGALGAEFARMYMGVKRQEWLLHNRTVTPSEREFYLATY
jgi:glutamine synthetase